MTRFLSYILLLFTLSLRHSSEGYMLRSKNLRLSHGSIRKIPEANILLNLASHENVVSNNTSHEYRQNPSAKSGDNKREILVGTLNLIKAMVGTGILALPMGVAKSSDFKTSIVPAIALMSTLGITSAYTFMLYGRLIHASQAKNLGELWEKNIDKKSAWLVSAVSLTFCYGACLAYTLCLGDVTSSLAHTVGFNGIWTSRQACIIFLTTTVLYPLCKLKSLISLAPLSLAGVGSVLITAVFIAWRCPFVNRNSPYSTMGVSELLKTLSLEQVPKFQTFNKGLLNPSSLILFGMAASAYLGHFIAPDLYHSLGKQDDDSNTKSDGVNHNGTLTPKKNNGALDSFLKISLGGFLSTIVINCFIMTFGFLTFGGNSMGVVLNNFSTLDKGATLCRLLTAVSIIGGYPFLIGACRGEISELYNLATNRRPTLKDEKLITATLLVSLTLISMVVSNAGLIIGLAGAVMGSALVYIFPSLLYLSATKTMTKGAVKYVMLERILCRFLVIFGTFAAFAGALTVATGA